MASKTKGSKKQDEGSDATQLEVTKHDTDNSQIPKLSLRKNLRTLLELEKVSITDLARSTGIAKQVLSDWLAGTSPRNLGQLKAVADYFSVSIEELCFETLLDKESGVIGQLSGMFGGEVYQVRIIKQRSEKDKNRALLVPK